MSYKRSAAFLLQTLFVPHTVPTVMSYFVTPSKNRLQKAHPGNCTFLFGRGDKINNPTVAPLVSPMELPVCILNSTGITEIKTALK